MEYPSTLSRDLKELSAFYNWGPDEKADVRTAFTDSQEAVNFFTVLAAAHRAGYKQCAGNGFIRLQEWCISNGLGDPFGPEFDVKALDALQV